MAKQEDTKSRLLHLASIFIEMTDEEHVMSTTDLNEELVRRMNMKPASRTTLYGDIDVLIGHGMDIMLQKGHESGYYLASREFELAELKILVDVVQASRFITKGKSNKLIKKLEKLTSDYEAKKLHRQVVVTNPRKAVNESIFYNVDEIHNAIYENKQISFQYCVWNEYKELIPKKNGDFYHISPWTLIWDDENYYLVGYDASERKIKHYRVDKMRKITTLDELRDGQDLFADFNKVEYGKKLFGMYSGQEEHVVLKCKKEYIGIILERFGMDVTVKNLGHTEGYVEVWIQVAVSNQFYGWLAGLNSLVQIEKPQEIAVSYRQYLQDLMDNL